jgi:hypothetical protein
VGNTAPVKALDGLCMYSLQLWWAIATIRVNSEDERLASDSFVLTGRCYAGVKALETSALIRCVADHSGDEQTEMCRWRQK